VFLTTSDSFLLSHRRALALAFRSEGFAVTVIAEDTGKGDAIRALGLDFVAWPLQRASLAPTNEAKSALFVANAYRRLRPTLAHHSSIKPVLYGSIAASLANTPGVINTMSGLGYALIERPNDTLKLRALRAFAYQGYRAVLRRAGSQSVFQNPDQMQLFLQRNLVDPARTTLIRGAGVDTVRFAPSPLPEGPFTVALPARMLWDKGVGEFVEAAKLLRAQPLTQTVRMALVGGLDPNNRSAISESTIRQWESEGLVEWWGHQADMAALWARAHLACLPSYAEGLPLALAEAASCQRAVVTTDVPGCRETVVDGETGWLVAVRDAHAIARAITSAASDRTELLRRGENSRKYAVEVLSEERVIRETVAVAKRLAISWPRP
jgi:glycosyltransferase involved in cell wall biosynthesis